MAAGGTYGDRLAPEARPLADALSAAFPDLGGTVTDAAEARRILAATPPSGKAAPPVGTVEDRSIPGPAGAPDLPVRVYRPEGLSRPRPTVVFFHGGGYTLCGLDTHDATARTLCAESGAVVVSVAYRLAPEHRFPAATEDAYAALCWAAAETRAGALGGDPGAVVTAGDSSGGGLATVAALMARDRGGPAVALQVLIYPVLDAGQGSDSYTSNATGYFLTAAHLRWFWEQYLGPDGDGTHPYASPLGADVTALPPAHIVTAGCDPLCDEGAAYADKLRLAGVPVTRGHHPEMFHGFLGFPLLLDDARAAVAEVAEAVALTVSGRKIGGDVGGITG
ncbi:alpha/beta hydrolase [Streptomyces sp. BA2]|uniref:alpha/beta hydrolase n=1 Tax=Streptomyces sp. BA2 TaxID=436595 RepID=UPI0013263046|nr:alpha/beta hydrolase [Streptomyces sp. BA2]MWA09454.1 alpha/beta hydrolase fold domain-containing protein [Streptomyces sp. BA2]